MTASFPALPRAFRSCALAALGASLLVACDDPVDPAALPELDVLVSAEAFADTEVAVGTDEVITIEIRNHGGGPLTVSSVALEGAHAEAFRLLEGADDGALAPGAARELSVGFAPTSEGTKSAVLAIATDDPRHPRVEVPVRGHAARFHYRQVDRMGIPGLNTVFNHPSGIAGFDKKAYNRASPADDRATYTGQFVTVLGAVGNADPAATAALLLPDELPVDLGAPTAFASLTGRALADDAVDVALLVTVGIAALQSDNVDANDKAFRSTFPYVAAPHQ
jgi:hypothetical protein